MDPFPGRERAADDEYRIISADRSQNVAPSFPVEGRGDRLSATRNRPENEHLTHSFDAEEKLGKQRVEGSATFLDIPIGDGISSALGRRHPREPELAKVTRQRGLGHIPAALEEQLPQVLLTADHLVLDDLEDGIVAFALVSHARKSLAQGGRVGEEWPRIIDWSRV